MHELPITESILEINLRHALASNALRINDLLLFIGDMSTVIDDTAQFYWDIVSVLVGKMLPQIC